MLKRTQLSLLARQMHRTQSRISQALKWVLGQGTNHLTSQKIYGIDSSVIPETITGVRGTMPTVTSAIRAVNFVATVVATLNRTSSEG